MKYYLINNNSHKMFDFPSKYALKKYAKIKGWVIKKSFTACDCYFIESFEYIPGNL